jgi:hypothetical protein
MSKITMRLGDLKRIPVFKKGVWVDTKPYEFTGEDLTKMLQDQPTGSLILQLWDENKRLKDAADISKLIQSTFHNGNICQDDCVSDDKSSSIEVIDQRKKKGSNKKGSNKKGSNKKGGNNGLDVKSDNKIGTNKKGSRTPKNDGSRSSNKKGGGGDK